MLYIDAERITPSALAKRFGIELPDFKKTESVVFEQLPNIVTIDRQNPDVHKFRRRSIKKDFVGIDASGETVRLTQSDSPLREDPKTKLKVSMDNPRHFQFYSAQVHLSTVKDIELITILMLSPENIESPFHKNSGRAPLYRLQNLERDANKDLALTRKFGECITFIDNRDLTVDDLRLKAAGMGMHNVTKMGEDQLKSTLMQMAKNDPNLFYERWTTQSTSFRGTLNVAMERGIVTVIETNGFKRVHTFIDGKTTEQAVKPKEYSGTDQDYVYDVFTQRFEELYIPVSKAVSGQGSTEVDKKMSDLAANQVPLKEKVEKMFAYRFLKLAENGDEAHVYQKGGKDKEDTVLFRVEKVDNYIAETTSFFEETVNRPIANMLWLNTSKKAKG